MKLNLITQKLNIYKNQAFVTNKGISKIDTEKTAGSDAFVSQEQNNADISTKNSKEKSKNLKQFLILGGIAAVSVITYLIVKSKKHQPVELDEKHFSPFFQKRLEKLKEMKVKYVDDRFMQKQYNKYTEDELKNIVVPFLQDSKPYNEVLRKGLDNKDILEKVAQIDKLIEKAKPLKKDAVVYRAIDGFSAKQFISDLCNNKFATDKGYMSTGTKLTLSEFRYFAEKENSFILRISVPKGTKGLYPSVSEIVLPRNSKLKFVSLDEELKIIDCEYVL